VIGVDTNILVRLLTADDAAQHATVLRFFESRSVNEPAFVSAVTMAKTIWVLRFRYRLPHTDILEAVSSFLDTDDFVVEGRDMLSVARDIGRPALLTDFLVAYLGERAGCSRTLTFDRRAAKSVPGMELLS
jgi:predicted nucleic-acid-binding protein